MNNPLLMTDGYKTSHKNMYPPNTTLVYSNYTCRSIKYMPKGAEDVVVFGIQYMIKYIQELWQNEFFNKDKSEVCSEAKNYLESYLGTTYDVSHFEKLHDLGFLPIEIKGLEEGTVINSGIPLFTIKNTLPEFFWLTNFLETLLSTLIWKPVHSASIAYAYKKLLVKYAKETGMPLEFVNFQGHDFSFRGMQSPESAIASAMGFLTSFSGTDTIPALQAIKHYYGDDNVGFSVPASEHSVMCAHGKEGEIKTLEYIMEQYPKGIVSVVSDTWDLWKLITGYLPQLKEEILARDGKIVIRPDSGDPVDIICGLNYTTLDDGLDRTPFKTYLPYDERFNHGDYYTGEQDYTEDENGVLNKGVEVFKFKDKYYKYQGEETVDQCEEIKNFNENSIKGVIELLWDIFGGTINEQGYKVLDSHIGAIYGDSITLERAEQIAEKLKAKGFANQVVFGIGSYSMGYATRDNQGGAVKSTYVEVNGEPREIFKNPVTDDGTKKSAKGLLNVGTTDYTYILSDGCNWEEESGGLLKTVFKDGKFYNQTTLAEIRNKLN